LVWVWSGPGLLTEADHLKLEVLTEAVILMMTASVNQFCETVFVSALVNI